MGRRRKSNFHLPPRMRLKHGAYYYTPRVNGKQKCIQLSRDYAEALALWAEYEGREGKNNGQISGMIDRFIREVLPSYSPKTKEDYLRYCGDLRNVFGDVAIDDLKPHEITTYLRRSTHKVQANRQIALLSRMYTVAVTEWGWLDFNPCKQVSRNPEKHRERYITDVELEQLKESASPQIRSIIELAYLTASRKGDLLKIRLGDIKPDGLHIKQQKTGKYQIYNWSPALREVVAQSKRLRRRASSLFLFATRDGTPYTVSGFNSIWRRLKTRVGLADIHFHDLRAKAVTDAKRLHGRDFAQALAGHASGDMTDAYVRDNPNVAPLK